MKGGRVPRRGFGELEQAVMEVVWARAGPVTGREVVEELARSRRVAYTTVLTVMDRLVRKGLLAKQATGRAHSYRPVESREAYTANLMARMLGAVDNPTAVLLHFVEQLPPDQTDELRSALQGDPDPTRQGTK
jgi:predicted transcriptional regulator